MGTFVVQRNTVTIHSHSLMVVAHSSYDMEMQAVHAAIEYILQQVQGLVIVFIDNQATLKSLFNTKPHSVFELSRDNCNYLGDWLAKSLLNTAEFWWIPSHLGFTINVLADKAANISLIGPFPFLRHTIASRIWHNRGLVVSKW